MSLLTVIIPTYNRPSFLERALLSVERNFQKELDIIVCDDKSDIKLMEKNKSIIKNLNIKYQGHIKYIINDGKKGVASARNLAIKQACSEWCFFLDDDDEIIDGYIKNVIQLIQTDFSFDLLWSNVIIQKDGCSHNNEIRRTFLITDKASAHRELISIGLGYGVVVRKKLLEKCSLFDENLLVAEDTDFFLKVIQNDSRIRHVNYFGTRIHEHTENKLTTNYEYHAKQHIFKQLYYKYNGIIKNNLYLYLSFTSWIIKVYQDNHMNRTAFLFCIEILCKNLFDVRIRNHCINEIKHLFRMRALLLHE